VKKVATILILIVFLFNVGGYYLIFWGVRQHHNFQFSARLDANQYSGSETVELKFHLPLPYPSLQYEYERVNGRFEHDGEFYKLIKKQLQNDTLYVLCIRDTHEEQIVNTLKEVESLTSERPASGQDISLIVKLLKDFESQEQPALTGTTGWVQSIHYFTGKFPIHATAQSMPSPPPRAEV
jgi:hypothetical protein